MPLRTLLRRTVYASDVPGRIPVLASPVEQLVEAVLDSERELWIVVVAAMLADVPLTIYGLRVGLTELNPIARSAIEIAGGFGLYALEVIAIIMGVCCTQVVPERYVALVPLGLAIPSVCAVLVNAMLISLTVT